MALIMSPDNVTEKAEASLASKDGNAALSLSFAKPSPGASVSMIQATLVTGPGCS